ncbi:MAG: PD-(D/E)XK nuclease family protein [Gammaproteobacteria bacterium]|nr:PD-(D/E)XK nuclease family protein [Gammaproteobacteria bacterium]
MNADSSIQLVPYGVDPLHQLASLLLAQHRESLPDLSQPIILFSHAGAVPRFRQILREQAARAGYPALLAPYCGTLAAWARQFSDDNKRSLTSSAREILLLGLLNDFPEWRDHYSAWPLIDSLLTLFDELTRHRCDISADTEAFVRQLRNYRANPDDFFTYEDEVRLVHRLWSAWRETLHKNQLQDQTLQTIDGLRHSLKKLPVNTQIYVTGFLEFAPAEIEWLKALHAQRRLTLLLQGQVDQQADHQKSPVASLLQKLNVAIAPIVIKDPYSIFLENTYTHHRGTLHERAHLQKIQAASSPARARLTIHEAADAEFEARAIDLQVRRWLVQGHRDIGIVTHDRKLARRVRALLERAHVSLQDAGGWALSTTSAATVLVRWLECLEQNFSHQPLLDLLKSPFLSLGFTRGELNRMAPIFEQNIVRAFNIASGLDNYRFALERTKNMPHAEFDVDAVHALTLLLERLENAAATLSTLTHDRPQSGLSLLEALHDSLQKLGLSASYQNDGAGRELLTVLEKMRGAASDSGLRLTWPEFHQWLKRNMEQQRFHPPMQGRGVELMSFAESRLYRFDALIIAGAVREQLPGNISVPPYFNDGVRSELGLPSLARRYAEHFADFRRLLEAAPSVMISLRRENRGEKLVPSPWVERLRSFHALAYQESLADAELEWLVQQADTLIVERSAPLPTSVSRPAARLPASLLPEIFSATDYQRLMDCPYQFLYACGLGLAAEQQIREEMEKVDFGTYVHRILQAFHSGVPGLPGPWRARLHAQNMAEAEKLLREITAAVFANDLRRRFFTRGWLYRWEVCIPAYLEWEKQSSAAWQIQATELKKTRDYQVADARLSITGRIDRLDRGVHGLRLIDYKTGVIPTRDSVMQGEKIQLPFYALLMEPEKITQALFLSIQDGDVTEKMRLDEENLATLGIAMQQRLLHLKYLLDQEMPLTAWGDSETCERCDMEGICRREMWLETDATIS